jgi:hypothetical protein
LGAKLLRFGRFHRLAFPHSIAPDSRRIQTYQLLVFWENAFPRCSRCYLKLGRNQLAVTMRENGCLRLREASSSTEDAPGVETGLRLV